MRPAIHYAGDRGCYVAYEVFGDGPVDMVIPLPYAFSLEHVWEDPSLALFLRRLARFCRVVLLDKRGTGLSDPVPGGSTAASGTADIQTVMDATEMDQAVVLGYSFEGVLCILLAASHPERISKLILFATFARLLNSPDYPWGWSASRLDDFIRELSPGGQQWDVLGTIIPSLAGDERYREWVATLVRTGINPGLVPELIRMYSQIDVRHLLPGLAVPTLIMGRSADRFIDIENSRYLAAHIPGAQLVEVPGRDHLPFVGTADSVLDHIEVFAGPDQAQEAESRRRRSEFGPETLTRREREVLELLCSGCAARDIGARLFISERTVETHVASAYRKLGIRSRFELLRRASEFGFGHS